MVEIGALYLAFVLGAFIPHALAPPSKGSNTLPALRSETPLGWSEALTSSPERGIQYVYLNLCLGTVDGRSDGYDSVYTLQGSHK